MYYIVCSGVEVMASILAAFIPIATVFTGLWLSLKVIPEAIVGEDLITIFVNELPEMISFIRFSIETFQNVIDMLPSEISAILHVFLGIMFVFLCYKFVRG